MASYRPLHPPPPQSNFPPPPPNQNSLPPPPPPHGGPNWRASNPNFAQNPNYQSSQQSYTPMPPQQQPLPYQPPPPPSMYYQSTSQYPPFNHNQKQNQPQPPPPPPSLPPPPPSSPPPPPPPPQPSSPPPLPSAKKDHSKKPPTPSSGNKRNERRTETEEERRLRKRREYEKMKQEEKLKQQKLREHKNKALEKATKGGHGSISDSQHMGDKRSGSSSAPLLSGDRVENRLKKPTTFICKLKFHNELPDPSAKFKLLALKRDPDRYCKYQITSLEKTWKPQLYVEPDLGIPLDLLDLSVYNPPKGQKLTLDPEDVELLHDDEPITPIKANGIKRKDRPTDKGVSWLVKTQYISPISMESSKQSLTEKQAKELREARDKDLLDNLNDRDRQIRDISASFEACKSKPVHATNPQLQPRRVLPLLPYFDRYEDQFVLANFDSAPTADSEIYRKLSASDRDEHEKRAIMRSYGSSSSDAENRDKFLAYMVPSVNELEKDIYDENEDISYSWVREYHWDVRGDKVDDPDTYLVTFGESEARYLPLPTKLILRKKRARDGKSTEETEHFPVPKKVTVRRRPNVSALELNEDEDYGARSRTDGSGGGGRLRRMVQDNDAENNFSEEAEDYMSD